MLDNQKIIRATQIDIAIARYAQPYVQVIINGFWRSGTTWLQECMAEAVHAKTIFEPLAAEEDATKELFKQIGIADPHLQQASILGPNLISNPATLEFLDSTIYGKKWGHFQRLCRRSVLESGRRQIIVKDVRFHFALSTLGRRYRAPIVHIRRHPCAVVASLSNVRWPWSFDDVTLSSLFEISLAGSTDEVWNRADIASQKFDGDMVSRIAAYWALVEWIAQREVALTESARIVWYEDILNDPQHSIRDLCTFCGLVAKRSFDDKRNSVVTSTGSKSMNFVNRKNSWRNKMADDDIKKINRIVEEIYPELNIMNIQ